MPEKFHIAALMAETLKPSGECKDLLSTSIQAASLLRVLEGVEVATKAPNEYTRCLAQWIETFVRQGSTPALSPGTQIDESALLSFSLPFDHWLAAFHSSSENSQNEVRQLAQITLAVALLREKSRGGQNVNTTCLDSIWGLIHDAIVNVEDTQLQFSVIRSAQGFLAVPLCSLVVDGRIDELWRIHTWLPDGMRGISEEVCIHAHQPFGQSWTLLGSGTDCTFEVESPTDPSVATHAAYECCYAGADGKQSEKGYQTHQISSTIRNTGRLVRVTPGSRVPHWRDMTYSVPGGAYHRSIVPGSRLHATLFAFDARRGYDDNAAVLGPKDGTEYLQPRDPAGNTAKGLVQMVNASRKWEQVHDIESEGDVENEMVVAYYRYFRGLGLLQAGQREEAFRYFNPDDGCSPARAFAREPSAQHDEYLRKLVEIGTLEAEDESSNPEWNGLMPTVDKGGLHGSKLTATAM